MENEYLPIGSVVLLKNANKRVMITGFYVSSQEVNSDKVYDYVGCLYPEGVISSSQNLVFDNDQISQIVFVGYRDIEEQLFKENLVKSIKEKNNKKDNEKIEKKEEMEIPVEEEKEIEEMETPVEEEKEIEEIETPVEEEKEIEEMETLFDEQPELNEMETSFSNDLNIEEDGLLFDKDSKIDDIETPLDEETIVEEQKIDDEKLNNNEEKPVRPSIYDELEILNPDDLYGNNESKENDDLEDISGNFTDYENNNVEINSFDDELLYGNDDINKDLEKIDF